MGFDPSKPYDRAYEPPSAQLLADVEDTYQRHRAELGRLVGSDELHKRLAALHTERAEREPQLF
jgi:hypothetical protein